MKLFFYLLFSGVLIVLCCSCAAPATEQEKPLNVILMIGDGMGFAQVKSYRLYADNPARPGIDPLPFEPYLTGAVVTDPFDASHSHADCGLPTNRTCMDRAYEIVDSAAAATAYASGQDTLNEYLGLSPDGKVLVSIAELGRQNGKAIGVVATSEITHATPAAFLSHVEDRDDSIKIADQLFDLQWEGTPLAAVMLGGGRDYLVREDRNLAEEFERARYTVVNNREELMNADNDRLLGLFAAYGLAYAWDREAGVPSLADMTQAALKALSRNDEGFFLMVEGSEIDWAAHDHDVAGVISEMEDFTAAIEVVMDFASRQGNTLVVITSDHETGGMSLGLDDVYEWNPGPIRGLKVTPATMTREFIAGEESLSQVMTHHVPFELTAEERSYLDSFNRDDITFPVEEIVDLAAFQALVGVLNQRSLTGWSTPGHTGVDVPLYAFGPGSHHFRGLIENEELGRRLRKALLPQP
jgi:alkaline phosphatase